MGKPARQRAIVGGNAKVMILKVLSGAIALMILLLGFCGSPQAATVTIACGAVGIEYRLCREGAEAWAAASGHRVELVQTPGLTNDRLGLFQQMLAAGSGAIDVFQIDVVWPGILGRHFIDLRRYFSQEEIQAHFQALIENNSIAGELKAVPWFTDVGLLYYREDLLEKYGLPVPRSWAALAAAARKVVEGERAGGRRRTFGFVFQGKAYEGLTCNALEWIHGAGGGTLLTLKGEVSFTNPRAVGALERAAAWLGTITPRGVLSYSEEEARGAFQSGHAVFMRNWPYAWTLANAEGSAVRGRVGVAPLPAPGRPGGITGTLGGWGLAVSRYSEHPAPAADLVKYLTGAREQARRTVAGGYNPTLRAMYKDPELLRANPVLAIMARILPHAVARPARQAGVKYNRFSNVFWNAVHDVLAGKAGAREALAAAERRLERLSRGGRW
jgi:trehalose/maltose transport system substrate-binding protein